jgi:glycosyltransferase involved in cell wall biosynthesis
MRIAYLTQSYPPMISGAALVVENLATGMAASGHEVLVIAASDTSQTYVVRKKYLTVLRLKSVHNPTRVGQRFTPYSRHSVTSALQEFRPEAIHSHEPMPISLPAIRYAGEMNVPTVITIHQLPPTATRHLPGYLQVGIEKLLWKYGRWYSKKFTGLITPTETTSDQIRKIVGRPVTTISNGIDLQTFHPSRLNDNGAVVRQKWNLPADVPILLHVGRLDPDKNAERVIEAAAQAFKGNQAHLLIVGDGLRKPALMKLCESLGIADRVHFTGFISTKQGLPELYRIAHLFITASEIETQGLVLLEAAASGLPIVAIRATCIPEIVHDGVNGFLAESGDVDGLSQRIHTLLSDNQKAAQMGKASLALAQKHDNRFTIEAHEKLYCQLIEQIQDAYPEAAEDRQPIGESV